MTRPAAGTADRRQDEAGFTLIEFLVAMVMIAMVMGSIGSTMVRRENRTTSLESAQAMQSLLFQARSDAILKGGNALVAIDAANSRYTYPSNAAPVRLPEGQTIRMIVGADFVSGDGSTYFLVFRPDGSSSGAEIVLSDARSGQARIEVNWLTGVPRLKAVDAP
jgi:general secretion pathway protein H